MITAIKRTWYGAAICYYNKRNEKQIQRIFIGPFSMHRASKSLYQKPYNKVILGA